jgi:hypothetical protein
MSALVFLADYVAFFVVVSWKIPDILSSPHRNPSKNRSKMRGSG